MTVKAEEMRTVRSNDGTDIAVFVTGEGPPLVLVHGTTADHTRWRTVLEPLAERFTVHAVDRRGRGASGDTEPYALEREFEDVAAVVDSIGEPVSLLGHSYGAVCALEASVRTLNLARLVLYEGPFSIDGSPISDPAVVERLQAQLEAGEREAVLETFLREVASLPDKDIEVMRSLPAWQARIAAAHTIPREERAEYGFDEERFRSMTTPTLLLLGGDSPPLFSEPIRVLEKVLPNVRVATMPGQQHAAIDTGTELFLREVIGFLTE